MADYFKPPHGGRPPSDEAVRQATKRYIEEEAAKAKSGHNPEREKKK